MKIQVLISTMNQENYSLLNKMNIQTSAVVINQTNVNGEKTFTHNGNEIKWIDTTERGLSKSRNMAIRNSDADICILADDDMVYRDNYAVVVKEAFENNPNYTIIGFEVLGIEEKFKNYPKQKHNVGYLQSMKMASVELALKRENIINYALQFDEIIGAGTKYYLGEENAFLFACLQKKQKILFIPQVIADLHIGKSTWFEGHTKEYFYSKGASYAAMNTKFTFLLLCQFAIRHYKKFKADCSVFKAIYLMNKGKKMYCVEKESKKK